MLILCTSDSLGLRSTITFSLALRDYHSFLESELIFVDYWRLFFVSQLHSLVRSLLLTFGSVEMSGEFMNKLMASNEQSPMLQNEYLREYLYIFGTALPELMKKKMCSSPNAIKDKSGSASPKVGTSTTGDEGDISESDYEDPIFEVPLLILDTKKVKLHLRDSNTETSLGVLTTKEGYRILSNFFNFHSETKYSPFWLGKTTAGVICLKMR